MKKIILILFCLLIPFAYSQEKDSTKARKLPKIEFAKMTKSPTGALVRSLILPGWGQIYVENYWKAPLVFGGFVGVGSIIYWNHDNYQSALDEIAVIEGNIAEYDRIKNLNGRTYRFEFEGGNTDYKLRVLKNKRDFYRDQRDLAGLYMLGVYIIAAVDSYVGAHLYDFNVNDDLSFNVVPNRLGFVSLQVSYSIK